MTLFAAYLAGALTVLIVWNIVYIVTRLVAGYRETRKPLRRVA